MSISSAHGAIRAYLNGLLLTINAGPAGVALHLHGMVVLTRAAPRFSAGEERKSPVASVRGSTATR